NTVAGITVLVMSNDASLAFIERPYFSAGLKTVVVRRNTTVVRRNMTARVYERLQVSKKKQPASQRTISRCFAGAPRRSQKFKRRSQQRFGSTLHRTEFIDVWLESFLPPRDTARRCAWVGKGNHRSPHKFDTSMLRGLTTRIFTGRRMLHIAMLSLPFS